MSMLTERLQVLISPEQRRRLEAEAERRGASVATVVREAIDAKLTIPTRVDRQRAFESIAAMDGSHLPVEELEAIVDQEREPDLPGLAADR